MLLLEPAEHHGELLQGLGFLAPSPSLSSIMYTHPHTHPHIRVLWRVAESS